MLGNLSVTGLYLSRCHQLYLDLSPPLPAPPPQVTIINTEYLSINISSTSPHLNITSINVTHLNYTPHLTDLEQLDDDDDNSDILIIIIATVSASVCITLIVVGLAIFFYYKRYFETPCTSTSMMNVRYLGSLYDSEGKKVSRAESWRYEGSMYIKPQPNPRFYNNVESSGGQSSVSSTPLMMRNTRDKSRLMESVDVVRTSLQSDSQHSRHHQRHNSYHGSPPPVSSSSSSPSHPTTVETPSHYKQPLDCIRPGQTIL